VVIPVNLCNLPPLNAIANKVLALSGDPKISLKEIGSAMQADPAFSADVLFLANSSLFGFPSRIHELRHALALLGLERVKALAVTVAMRGFLGRGGPLVNQCWRHSAACAVVCEHLAPMFHHSPNRGFTAGIIHDVGRLALLKTYSTEYGGVLSRQYADVSDALRAERAALNVDHAVAGAWLVKTWSYPGTFIEICQLHHALPERTDSSLVALTKVACRVADALGYPAVRYRGTLPYRELLPLIVPRSDLSEYPAEDELKTEVEGRLRVLDD